MSTWKVIKEYPNYSVSDEGDVKNNTTGKILKPHLDSNGYLSVCLYREKKSSTKRIHKLVAEAYIPNPFNLPDVNHIDGIRTNNSKDNLEWRTRSGNMLHTYRELGKKPRSTDRKAVLCVETGEMYSTVEAAAKSANRSSMAIRKCLYGWTKTSAGLHWRDYYDYENGSDPGGEGYDLWLCKSRWEEYFGVPEE